ncbi:pre-mRNA-processing factor 39, partial [Monoraphidium neglectum]
MTEAVEAQDMALANGSVEQTVAPDLPLDPLAAKLAECWNVVRDKPEDFAGWTALASAAEKLVRSLQREPPAAAGRATHVAAGSHAFDDPEQLSAAYEALLAEWPLCYAYWKKLADALTRHGRDALALEALERGAAAVPYSVPFWEHYAAHVVAKGADLEAVRSVFERGVAYCSTDYRAAPLWDAYIAFERGRGGPAAAAAVYARALQCPLESLDRLEAG